MPAVSAKDLQDDQRRRWVKARKEIYRGVLRDPRSSDGAKAQARKKLEATK